MTKQPSVKYSQRTPNPYGYLLYLSLANSFCCCFCLGLVAVHYATKVNYNDDDDDDDDDNDDDDDDDDGDDDGNDDGNDDDDDNNN